MVCAYTEGEWNAKTTAYASRMNECWWLRECPLCVCLCKCVNGRTSVEWSCQKRHVSQSSIDWIFFLTCSRTNAMRVGRTHMQTFSLLSGERGALARLYFPLCFGVYAAAISHTKNALRTNEPTRKVNELLAALRTLTTWFPFDAEKIGKLFLEFSILPPQDCFRNIIFTIFDCGVAQWMRHVNDDGRIRVHAETYQFNVSFIRGFFFIFHFSSAVFCFVLI